MNARAMATWSGAALVVVLTSTNPVYRALVLLVGLNSLLALRRHDAALRPLFLATAVGAVLAALFNTLLSHTGADVLVMLPQQLPGVGGPVTVEALLYGLDVALGLSAAIVVIAPLSRALHPHDLIDAFPGPLQRTAALIGAAINLVPAVARNAVTISEANRMRGAGGGRLRDVRAVATPIVLCALDDSLQLAQAMEARGFGSGKRTRYAGVAMGSSGLLVVLCAIAAASITLASRATGALPDWSPFPNATLPDVATAEVAACLLLAAPLVAWRRS